MEKVKNNNLYLKTAKSSLRQLFFMLATLLDLILGRMISIEMENGIRIRLKTMLRRDIKAAD
jgi:hypothetical protein